jgi:hypothetical protein
MSKMRPLWNDEQTKAKIAEVVTHAENRPLTISMMQEIADGHRSPPGDDPRHSCILCRINNQRGTGYRCVYTIDQAPKRDSEDVVWLRHLSISVDGSMAPNPMAIDFIMREFGFRERLCNDDGGLVQAPKIQMWTENEKDDSLPTAVNIVELYEEDALD